MKLTDVEFRFTEEKLEISGVKASQIGGAKGLVDIARELGSISVLMSSTPEMNTERLMLHFGVITDHLQHTFGKEFGKEFGKKFGKRNPNLEYCFRSHSTLP